MEDIPYNEEFQGDFCKKLVKTLKFLANLPTCCPGGASGARPKNPLRNYFLTGGKTFIVFDSFWTILSLNWRKWLKNRQNNLLGYPGGPTQKKNLQNVSNHQYETFLGQKFFSKNNFSENWKKVDAFGPFSTVQTSEA